MDYLQRLLQAFPTDTYANTIRALREGVAAADDAIKGIPLLDTPVGRDCRGLVRRAGILHRFEAMCKAGDLPFSCDMAPMPRGNWHWLNIQSEGVIGHIVRTEKPNSFPEDTPNRQDQRARNQGDLFDNPDVVPIESLKLYAWLCYRATPNGALAHAFWNMPSAGQEGKEDAWLARVNLMNVMVPRKSEDLDRPAKVDPRARMKLKEIATDLVKKKNDKA